MLLTMASRDINAFTSDPFLCISIAKEDEINMLFLSEEKISFSLPATRKNLTTFGIFSTTKPGINKTRNVCHVLRLQL